MKTKKIYIIRHGQTDYNKNGLVQGSGIDAPLNEEGRRQAQAFYEEYSNYPFNKIYISTLQRTYQSVEKFIEKGIPYEKLKGLDEIYWGSKEGLPVTPEENAYYHYIITEWANGNITLPVEGGESPVDVQARQKPALDHILAQIHEENILICMHGRAMRMLLCLMLNYELKCMDQFEHTNLGLYKLTYTGSMFTIDLFNDLSHLTKYYNKIGDVK